MQSKLILLPDKYETQPAAKLLNIKLQMEKRIDEIQGQIDRAKLLAATPTDGFGSRSWQQRAVKSRKAYGRDIQLIQNVLESRKEEQKASTPPLADHFVTIARRRLDETVFNDIMNEAREEL